MFILINKMSGIDETLGRVISRHRTAAAAGKANRRLQRKCERDNGRACYIPTAVRATEYDLHVGNLVYRDSVIPLTDDQQNEYDEVQM